ncbi:hypothetical protein [Pseudooceanicola sp.]|uniref:hypothetical protein n=1 Tax=Pseudooceanicola sp. TaxID=1914328 RepID=UPI0035C6C3C0
MPTYHPDAVTVVTDPARFAHLPALTTDAWLRLKEQQGAPVTPDRLARIDRDPAENFTPLRIIDLTTARERRGSGAEGSA